MNLPGFYELLVLSLKVGLVLGVLALIADLIFPLFRFGLVMRYVERSELYAVYIQSINESTRR